MKCHCREHAALLNTAKQECAKPHPGMHCLTAPDHFDVRCSSFHYRDEIGKTAKTCVQSVKVVTHAQIQFQSIFNSALFTEKQNKHLNIQQGYCEIKKNHKDA